MKKFEIGDEITCKDAKPLIGNHICPPLVLGNSYKIKGIVVDKENNQHLDIGLVSKFNFIRSYQTGEKLPNGDMIHWCSALRF